MPRIEKSLCWAVCASLLLLAAGCSAPQKADVGKPDPQNPPPTPEEVRTAIKKNFDALYFDEHHKTALKVEKVVYAFDEVKISNPVMKGDPPKAVFTVKTKVGVESMVKDGKSIKVDRGGESEPFYFYKDSKGEWLIIPNS